MKRLNLHFHSWEMDFPMMLFCLFVLIGTSARAQVASSFSVGNLNYSLISADEQTVEVTGGNDVSGELVIPANVTYNGVTYRVKQVGNEAFQNNDGITSLTFEDGVESVGYNSFDQCPHIRSINIPASMISLYPGDDNPFSVEDDLESIVVAAGNPVYDSRGNCNAIIETATSRMIAGCKATVMPASLKSIAYDTFQRAYGMTEVTIAEGVTWIENGAFENCQDLVVVYSKATTAYPIATDAFNISYANAELRVPVGSKASYESTEGWNRFSRIVEVEGGGTMAYGDGELQPDGTVTWTVFQGAKMTFKVIDAEKKWVQVGNGIAPSISQDTAGEVTIPNEIVIDGETYIVVGIGDYGFYNCDKLTAIWLPESLTFIGKYAFYGCKLVGKIQIPVAVYAIDNTAFEGCTGLTEFSCPYIDGFDYPSCPVLTIVGYAASDEDYDVVIPQPVTSIGQRAFSYCATIRTMRVEEGNSVFDSRNDCNAIIRTSDNVLLFGCKTTVIPSTVTGIDAYAFEGHTGLTTIAIPTSVTTIGKGAFADCTGLNAVTSNIIQPYAINDNTFSASTYQTATLYVPHSTKTAYQTTGGWKNFQNIVEMDEEEEMTLEYTDPTSNVVYVYTTTGTTAKVKAGDRTNWTSGSPNASGNVVILDKITVNGKEYTVTEIGDLALYGRSITSINIPATIETIGQYACYGWYLTNVTVLGTQPASLTSLSFSQDSYHQATLSVPVGAEDNYFNANGWKEFFSYVRKDGIIYHISSWDQHKAEVVGLYGEANGILNISSSVEKLGESFNVTTVRRNAFHGNSTITSVIIPSAMTDDFSFEELFPDNPFSSCTNLREIVVADGNSKFDSHNNCNAIVEKETNTLVVGCSTTIIPNDVVAIARDAFYGATFTEIVIPASVQSIGQIAFGNCNKLNAFKVLSKTPCTLDKGVFDESSHNVFQYATLYVPKGYKTAYEAADVWKNFTNIVEMEEEVSNDPIVFADAEVKRICVENWDGNVDGELSYAEAARVTDLGKVFQRTQISTFDELQYFTGLNAIGEAAFSYSSVSHVVLPNSVKTIGRSAFNSCYEMKTIDFPSSLQEIATNAFFYGGLTQIVIPKTLTKIGIEPFFACPIESIVVDDENEYYDSRENCNALIETATNRLIVGTADAFVPNTVTSIGGGAFYGAPNNTRTSLEIPSSVVNIERCILRGNTAMTALHIPASVRTISREAFNGVENLATISVDPANEFYDSRDNCNAIIETATNTLIRGSIAGTIPSGVEIISGYAFYESNVASVVIPEGVKEIGFSSFEYCYQLKSVEIPSTVTRVGGSAFYQSSNIGVVKVHISAPYAISENCFNGWGSYGVKEDATLYVPYCTKSLYEQTDGWKSFKNIVEMMPDPNAPIEFADAGVKRICVENWDDNKDGKLSYGEAAAVTDLGLVFKSNSTITSFEELAYFTGLTEIPGEAFYFCTSLQSVVLPENLQSIGLRAFMECKLQSIIIPNNVQTIAQAAFADCGLSTISIPASVTSIGNYVFAGNSQLSTIVVDTNNPVYDSRNGCNAIINKSTNELIQGCVSTIIPSEIKSISDGAFELMNIEHINLPQGLERIGFNAFYGCPLREIVFPEGLTYIGRYSFNGCDNLTEFHVPQSVQFVDGSAIAGCGGITSISVADGNANYSSAAGSNAITNKDGTVLVMGSNNTIIPSTVKSIADDSFRGRWNLAAIEIPESVESIGGYAFCECSSLTSIVIPKNVTEINEYAFANCTKLRSVTLMKATPISITDRTFDYTSETTLYVPFGSKTDYEAANVWKEFKEIVEVKPDNFLYANEATIRLGDKKTIVLQLDNTESLVAADFRLQLPAGLSIEKNGNGDFITEIVSARRVNHTLAVADEGNGLYHFLSYSNPIRAYKGNAGDFITLSIVSDGSMQEGTYTATLKSIIFSDENEQKLTFTDSSFEISVIDYTPGDADGDNHLDVVDVVKVVSHIMGRNPSNFNFIAVDLDGNGKVNVMDLVNLIDLIMSTPQQSSAISAQGQMGTLELSKSDDETIAMNVPFANQHVAAQFMVSLSDGTVLQDVVTDKAHRSQFTRIADGRYKVMVFSNNNATFSSDSPIKLQLNGSGNVKVEETVFVDTDEEAVAFEATTLGTTGIATVGTSFAKPSDIYTVDGKLVKKDATSTQGIAKGVYIVNNQKVIVK